MKQHWDINSIGSQGFGGDDAGCSGENCGAKHGTHFGLTSAENACTSLFGVGFAGHKRGYHRVVHTYA
jgi:hypothetical protein